MLKKIKHWIYCHIFNEHEKSNYYGLDENFNKTYTCKHCFKKIRYDVVDGNWVVD